jgi:decaprenylphospho-beta-D-erythro-pentofuranosid-2-ulose 2-reductase
MSKYILIIGASSDMARAVAKRYAKEKYNFYLAGRNSEDLKRDAADLAIRFNVNAIVAPFDVLDYHSHESFYASLYPSPVGTICFAGYMGQQQNAEKDFEEALRIMNTNYIGCVSILNIIANDYETKKGGFIIGVSSVAGDRGRGSNK